MILWSYVFVEYVPTLITYCIAKIQKLVMDKMPPQNS